MQANGRTMKTEEKKTILQEIAQISGEAGDSSCGIAEYEENRLEDFLMLDEYTRLQEPRKFLILGGRGSGKTRLFQTFNLPEGLRELFQRDDLSGLNATNATVVKGYDREEDRFPAAEILENYASDKTALAYWNGSLLFQLLDALQQELREDALLQPITKKITGNEDLRQFMDICNLKSVSSWIPYIQNNPEIWSELLDQINAYLLEVDRWIFVSYDCLDRLTYSYENLFPFIRTLLSFWALRDLRWKRIRCKIFLRNDLYESKSLSFMDASKLNVNTIRLEWNPLSLYRLFVKRLANAGNPEALAYLRQIQGLVSEKKSSSLGFIPTKEKGLIEQFVIQLIGKYMGNSPKRGLSYQWMPNHLQDANGALAPRAFIKCFSTAAVGMLNDERALASLEEDRLILPTMIQNALVSVSEDRVKELSVEEYPWLETLKPMLQGMTMLVDQRTFLNAIDMTRWTDEDRKKLPSQTEIGLFDVLMKLGIVYLASDGRVNVPEIYLHGFGMKRRGGLRRKV